MSLIRWCGALVVGVGLVASCNKNPAGPAGAAATITITSAGVTPKDVQIPLGARVRFVNNDAVEHDMGSDPHPDHTDCPPINQVDLLKPGEQRETGNMVVLRTCGFHDHDNPNNTAVQGSIVIQ